MRTSGSPLDMIGTVTGPDRVYSGIFYIHVGEPREATRDQPGSLPMNTPYGDSIVATIMTHHHHFVHHPIIMFIMDESVMSDGFRFPD